MSSITWGGKRNDSEMVVCRDGESKGERNVEDVGEFKGGEVGKGGYIGERVKGGGN